MDYKRKLSSLLCLTFTAIFLVACDTGVDPDPLRITGTPPEDIYYDSVFEYEFGVAGGEGPYRYRYIQNPSIDEDEEAGFVRNNVEMTIEVTDDAKPSFILRALPKVPDGESFDDLDNSRLKYALEVTDGNNTVTREFEFTLRKNKLNFLGELNSSEGLVNNRLVQTLNNQLNVEGTSVCNQVTEKTLNKRVNEFGQTVYPYVFQVVTDVRTASRTELFYRFTTAYRESSPERSKENLNHARKNIDYVDAVRSIVLEPNKARCLAYIDVLDDNRIENTESLTVEFFDSVGGAIDISDVSKVLEIRDNELKPEYATSEMVRNRGDKIVVPISLVVPLNYPLSVNVSVDQETTTASNKDFLLEPQSGVVVLEAGQLQSSYVVNLLNNPSQDAIDSPEDLIIKIKTDLDDILEVEPLSIEINEWANTSDISKEVVATGSNTEKVIDFTVDEDGLINTLSSDIKNSNQIIRLKSYQRDASPINFTEDGVEELSRVGLDLKPISIHSITQGDVTTLSLILNVDNLYADQFRGGTDFVVINYTRENGQRFRLASAKQYGSEGDDSVTGSLVDGSTLYVFGSTTGEDFEGAPSNQTRFGGKDGFIYSIDVLSNEFNWARLVGTSNDDNVVALDVGNIDLIAAVSTKNTDEDVLIRRLNIANGEERFTEFPVSIASNDDDTVTGIEFDASASSYRVLAESRSDLSSDNEPTPSLSKDAQLLTFASDNDEPPNSLSFATEFDDFAKGLRTMPKNANLIVSGETLGELEGALKRGSGDVDLFAAIIDLEDSSNAKLDKAIQFGTTEDDAIIAVKAASSTKFFILWKEAYTNAPYDTYRISAFSVDGKKLSRDP